MANPRTTGRSTPKKTAPMPSDKRALDRYSWRNWTLLSAVSIVSTLALVLTVPPLISENTIELWPWAPTDLVLLCGLVVAVIVFVLHLTQQQRNVVKMRTEIGKLEQETICNSEKNASKLYALLNVSHLMSTITDLQEVFDCITKMSAEIFECDRASLMLFDEQNQELVVKSTNAGPHRKTILNTRKKIGDGIAGWVAEHREPLLLGDDRDFEKYPHLQRGDASISAAMVVPIILRGELVGILNISTRQPGARYDAIDLQALQVFAENAGSCIRHTQQADWMRKTIQRLQETAVSRN
jgi:transcriptional regulator with GAF, ATPase, and Fis domain